MPEPSPSPYERLVELSRLELEAVEEGDWMRVQALQLAQASLRHELGDTPPPPSARSQLEEAARLNAEVLGAIQHARAVIHEELVRIGRERTAAAGYAATGVRRPQAAWEG